MKVHKAIAYSSLLVMVLTAAVLGSLPLRFPNATIAWRPIAVFSMPAVGLVALLLIRPALSVRVFRPLVVVAAILGVGATLFGRMPLIILGLYLLALAALYIQAD